MDDNHSVLVEDEAHVNDITDDRSLLLHEDSTSFQADWLSVSNDLSTNALIMIQRQAYSLPVFDAQYNRDDTTSQSTFQQIKSYVSTRCLCSGDCVKEKLLGLLPVIKIMQEYRWKKWFLSDLIAGLCVGVINVPQGMGYAILASLPPVYGLYASLFPILIYFLFGTSRHISVGTMAIISILIGNVVEREAAHFIPSHGKNSTAIPDREETIFFFNDPRNDPELTQFKVKTAMTLSFLVGLIQIGMSFLRLGILATFMSIPFIGGFMAGATVHIITSQVPFCLGVNVARQTGMFNLIKQWLDIIQATHSSNIAEVVITIICIVALLLMKEGINEHCKHRLKIPIPAELLVVSIAIPVSYFAKLHSHFHIQVLSHIPMGIPAPEVPMLHNASDFITDAFVIAVVSFAINISLVKYFSEQYQYPVDQDQEMLAYGIMHTFGAFFTSFAGAQAPARTMVHESTGGQTQVASLFSGFLVLLVCFCLAPVFEHLPTSVLGSVIIVAIIPLLKRFQDLPHLWRVNKYDFLVWVVSFVVVVTLDINIGLVIGIGLSVFTLITETVRVSGFKLGLAEKTELFVPSEQYKGLSDISKSGIFVFKAQSPLYFANTEALKRQLFAETIDPKDMKRDTDTQTLLGKQKECVPNGRSSPRQNNSGPKYGSTGSTNLPPSPADDSHSLISGDPDKCSSIASSLAKINQTGLSTNGVSSTSANNSRVSQPSPSVVIVLDCSCITYIDLAGLNLIKQLRSLYMDVGGQFVLANCNRNMLRKLVANGDDVNEFAYPSVVDAVVMTKDILL